MSEFRLKFKYEHGSADNNRLNLYDGAKSLEGIARSITMVTNALINGEVRTRADSAQGAEFYLKAPQRGSFIYEASIFISGAITSGIFYDFVKYTLAEAVGKIDEASESARPSVQKRIEPTIGELPATLESALIDVHRPIRQDPNMTLSVTKPRGAILVEFNEETGIYLQPREMILSDPVIGKVTRYNTISKWGKMYDHSEKRVISFFLNPDLSDYERSLITWSLHEANLNREGALYMKATAIVTPNDRVKRYNISNVSNKPIVTK